MKTSAISEALYKKRYRFKQNTIDFRTSTEEKHVKNKVKFEKHEKIQFSYLKTTKSKFLNHKVQTPESSYYHKICRLYAFRIKQVFTLWYDYICYAVEHPESVSWESFLNSVSKNWLKHFTYPLHLFHKDTLPQLCDG